MASYSGQYAVILVKRNGDGRIDQTLETGFEGDYDYCNLRAHTTSLTLFPQPANEVGL